MYKVFIIQLTRMGDIIQTLPLLKHFHETYSDLQVTFLCVSEFSEIIRNTPLVHRYIKIPASKIVALRRKRENLANFLRAHPFVGEKYDIVINLTHDFEAGCLSSIIRSKKKSGLVCESETISYIPDRWGRYLFSVVRNRLENTFNLVDIHIGMGGLVHKPIVNYLTAPDRLIRYMNNWLMTKSLFSGRPLIIFHLGASRAQRVWPIEAFVRLGELVVKKLEAAIILTGKGTDERQASESFLKLWTTKNLPSESVINMVDRLNIHNLVALVSIADLLISGDTGPIHIAAAVGTKTIGLYIATAYPGETAPYGSDHIVVHPDVDCYPCLRKEEFGKCGVKCRNLIKPEYIHSLAESVLRNYQTSCDFENVKVLQSSFLSNGTLFYVPLDYADGDNSFTQRVLNRFLWEAILGLESDFALKNAVASKRFREEALKLFKKFSESKIDCIECVEKLKNRLFSNHEISKCEKAFAERFSGLLRYYFSIIPSNSLKSRNDALDVWEKRLTDVERATQGLKRVLEKSRH